MLDQAKTALIVVDMQNDFMPNGALAVAGANEIVASINQLAKQFHNVILTQDWHTANHLSFAEQHQKNAFDVVEMPYGSQVLWPVHCVQGSHGAAFHADLSIPHAALILRKGIHREIDSYSAFMEADRQTHTGLTGYLKEKGIEQLYIVGVATDFCVAWTAIDACQFGFQTYVIEDACRAIDLDGSLAQAWQAMQAQGVQRVQLADVPLV